MDETKALQSLDVALEAARDLKEEYIKVQDFDNAAKWRDIADVVVKSILMSRGS